uniref:Uncharacterized protein n=1 Tax=Setaria viridis TaxID=4556 RepID=A0A4V6Y7Y0_SETVI|nr:hypothetical protein SEVIR_8G136600v2 [Setaria viridis]
MTFLHSSFIWKLRRWRLCFLRRWVLLLLRRWRDQSLGVFLLMKWRVSKCIPRWWRW